MNKFIFTKDLKKKSLVGEEVVIFGWIAKKISVSKFYFVTLRDGFGFCQLVIDKTQKKLADLVATLTKESVVRFEGRTQMKKTNDVQILEIVVKDLKIINYSKLPPFMIKDQTDGQEKIRLTYRYLDLRRPEMQKTMWLRHHVYHQIRTFFIETDKFIEMETPILATPTIEGANNFLVNCSAKKGYYFALPQSPQLYKQLLMTSGFPGYFQIARCFRDEDLRNDRQPEFSQLDLEINFADQNQVMDYIEKLMIILWKKFVSSSNDFHFIRIKYDDAWNIYGTDKPDLRYQLFLEKHSFLLINNEFSNEICKGILFEKPLDGNTWGLLQKEVQKITKKPLYFFFNTVKGVQTNLSSLQQKKITQYLLVQKLSNWIGYQDKHQITNLVLGKVRIFLADFFELTKNKKDQFCWIVEQPMFQFSHTEKKYVSTHHPFCQPKNIADFNKDWKTSFANAYDLVVNGVELGSGSVRIHDLKLQKQVFHILGINEKTMEDEFGFLLNAMNYGFPNHAGFALGLDRLMMIVTNSNSIRDVVVFPKTSKFTCLLTKTPKKINSQ